jgi:ATP-dependent Clp protease ATP-binding subunit ClpB
MDDIKKIVDIQIGLIEKRLSKHKIKISIDETAREHLAKEGFSTEFGARPLKRLLQKMILDQLADRIIRGELKDGGKVKINFRANSLVFTS